MDAELAGRSNRSEAMAEILGEWSGVILDVWLMTCVVCFIYYVTAQDIEARKRKWMLFKGERSMSVSSLVEKQMDKVPSSSSSLESYPYQDRSGTSLDKLTRTTTPQKTSSIPRVLFKPIVEGVEMEGGKNQTKYFPIVGKRVSRDSSNNSVGSLPSILRNNSSSISTRNLILQHYLTSSRSPERKYPNDYSSSRSPSPNLFISQKDISQQFGECPVCYGVLHKEAVSLCAGVEGEALCCHFYHDRCLKVLRRRSCLICGVAFKFRRRLPPMLEDPSTWFKVLLGSREPGAGVTLEAMASALAAQFPIRRSAAISLLKKKWSRWDRDNNGSIDESEFLASKNGLLAYFKKKIEKIEKLEKPNKEAVPVDLRDSVQGWFTYFDEDGNGELDKSEVLRGLIVSFSLTNEEVICLNLRSVLDAVWPVFDTDMNGCISKEEFLKPKEGLGHSLLSSVLHSEHRY